MSSHGPLPRIVTTKGYLLHPGSEGLGRLLLGLQLAQKNGRPEPVLLNVFSVHHTPCEWLPLDVLSPAELQNSHQTQVFWALVLCTWSSLGTTEKGLFTQGQICYCKKQLFCSRFFFPLQLALAMRNTTSVPIQGQKHDMCLSQQ